MGERENLCIAGIVRESIVDGPGMRFVVFVQGCPHHCPGCHNPQSHSFDGGSVCSVDRIFQEICKNPMIRGVTFSGGEPFCQAAALANLAGRLKECGMHRMIYTGYTFEQLLKMGKNCSEILELLKLCDVLVDGPFILAQKSLMLHFRGSRNQRILDVPRSLESGIAIPVPWQDGENNADKNYLCDD